MPGVRRQQTKEARCARHYQGAIRRKESAKRRQVEVAVFQTMAWFMVVEHVNDAMFDPLGRAI
jgi:hypothetical protein